ncbi:MAG: hypothetical protein EAZ83_04775 [Oscillatoriales cyanobacterium]|nr:MAG: hypothetical protein EAZ83_04775 [Oscillatoriales cyanobacterium]TAE96885.1 MAG: hypothetical protein EAZ79_12945 [Oscillatoriales cyanobacterium]
MEQVHTVPLFAEMESGDRGDQMQLHGFYLNFTIIVCISAEISGSAFSYRPDDGILTEQFYISDCEW